MCTFAAESISRNPSCPHTCPASSQHARGEAEDARMFKLSLSAQKFKLGVKWSNNQNPHSAL